MFKKKNMIYKLKFDDNAAKYLYLESVLQEVKEEELIKAIVSNYLRAKYPDMDSDNHFIINAIDSMNKTLGG